MLSAYTPNHRQNQRALEVCLLKRMAFKSRGFFFLDALQSSFSRHWTVQIGRMIYFREEAIVRHPPTADPRLTTGRSFSVCLSMAIMGIQSSSTDVGVANHHFSISSRDRNHAHRPACTGRGGRPASVNSWGAIFDHRSRRKLSLLWSQCAWRNRCLFPVNRMKYFGRTRLNQTSAFRCMPDVRSRRARRHQSHAVVSQCPAGTVIITKMPMPADCCTSPVMQPGRAEADFKSGRPKYLITVHGNTDICFRHAAWSQVGTVSRRDSV